MKSGVVDGRRGARSCRKDAREQFVYVGAGRERAGLLRHTHSVCALVVSDTQKYCYKIQESKVQKRVRHTGPPAPHPQTSGSGLPQPGMPHAHRRTPPARRGRAAQAEVAWHRSTRGHAPSPLPPLCLCHCLTPRLCVCPCIRRTMYYVSTVAPPRRGGTTWTASQWRPCQCPQLRVRRPSRTSPSVTATQYKYALPLRAPHPTAQATVPNVVPPPPAAQPLHIISSTIHVTPCQPPRALYPWPCTSRRRGQCNAIRFSSRTRSSPR